MVVKSNFDRVLITGGAGFIGSALVRFLIKSTNVEVVNVDKLTYSGNLESLGSVVNAPRHIWQQVDICDLQSIRDIFSQYRPQAVMHLAAESHVDRSIDKPSPFIETNIIGTYTLLEASREYFRSLKPEDSSVFRFHHISTDEVYGSLGLSGSFTEESPYKPNSPYSSSKAAADHLVRAWGETYKLPVIISNCSNNYGPFQFPEKLIPLMVLNAIDNKPLPVYGAGDNVRDWLYVDDHVQALWLTLNKGSLYQTYNIGGGSEKTNLEVVESICSILDELRPRNNGDNYSSLISFVKDRPGHDKRYSVDWTKIRSDLNWEPQETFVSGLRKTVQWYLNNSVWWRNVLDGTYRCERLGLMRNFE